MDLNIFFRYSVIEITEKINIKGIFSLYIVFIDVIDFHLFYSMRIKKCYVYHI